MSRLEICRHELRAEIRCALRVQGFFDNRNEQTTAEDVAEAWLDVKLAAERMADAAQEAKELSAN